MAEKNNIAHRLHKILVKAHEQQGNTQCVEVWARIFDIKDSHMTDKSIAVSSILSEMNKCLAILKGKTIKLGIFTSDVYAPHFVEVKDALSVHALTASWENIRPKFRPEISNIFRIISQVLPEDEQEINPEDMDTIKEKLEEIRGTLGHLPAEVRDLFLYYIRSIEQAIQLYRIKGDEVFTEALHDIMLQFMKYHDIMQSYENPESPKHDTEVKSDLQKLAMLWNFIRERVNDGDTLVKLYVAGEFVNRFLLPAAQKLLP